MPKITTSNTTGEGDCAFHAIFGEFINGKFYYNDVAAKRKEISKLIATCQEPPVNQELFAAVKVGLTEMHDLKPEEQNACPAIMKLRNFVNTDKQSALDAALQVLEKLSEQNILFKNIIEKYCIEHPSKVPGQQLDNFHKKYMNWVGQHDNADIYKILTNLQDPQLLKAYEDYQNLYIDIKDSDLNLLTNKYFKELPTEIPIILKELAEQFIDKQSQWIPQSLIPAIAIASGKEVHYYAKNPNKPEFTSHRIYNQGGNPVVYICFNGSNHYEHVLPENIEDDLVSTIPPIITTHSLAPVLPELLEEKTLPANIKLEPEAVIDQPNSDGTLVIPAIPDKPLPIKESTTKEMIINNNEFSPKGYYKHFTDPKNQTLIVKKLNIDNTTINTKQIKLSYDGTKESFGQVFNASNDPHTPLMSITKKNLIFFSEDMDENIAMAIQQLNTISKSNLANNKHTQISFPPSAFSEEHLMKILHQLNKNHLESNANSPHKCTLEIKIKDDNVFSENLKQMILKHNVNAKLIRNNPNAFKNIKSFENMIDVQPKLLSRHPHQ